jgi:tetratricopeptide (TPR) repeat protein
MQLSLISRISKWLRRDSVAEPPPSPPENVLSIVIPMPWENTELKAALLSISQNASTLDTDKLLASAEGEIREAKAAKDRKAHVSAAFHLYRAQAFGMLAKVPDSAELVSNLAWELSEPGFYATAAIIGQHAYDIASDGGKAPEKAGMQSLKLAVYEFYLGNPLASRQWLKKVPREMHEWGDYVKFERKVSLCEQALIAFKSELAEPHDYQLFRTKAKELLERGEPSNALKLAYQAYLSIEHNGTAQQLFDIQVEIARILFGAIGFYSESASWYLKSFHVAASARSFDSAAEALVGGIQALLETGNRASASEAARRGLDELEGRVHEKVLVRLYGFLALSLADDDATMAANYLAGVRKHLVKMSREDVLEWSLGYGRLFVDRENEELAALCLSIGLEQSHSGYYSPRVGSLLRESARLDYMQKRWSACLWKLNESRNLSHRNRDYDGVCAAMLRTMRVYQTVNERGLAAKTVQAAMSIGPERITEARVREELMAASIEFFVPNVFGEPTSEWNGALLAVLQNTPGSNSFNQAVEDLRRQVSYIEESNKLTPNVESELFRFPFIFAAYGAALDRCGNQRAARHYLARAYRMHRTMRDFPEAASTLHEYAVARARSGSYYSAKRAFLVAIELKRRYGAIAGHWADSLLGFVQASIIVQSKSGLSEALSELLREAESSTSMWSGEESFNISSVKLTVANGYLLLGNLEEADKVAGQLKASIANLPPGELHTTDLMNLARFELERDRASQSLYFSRQALRIAEETRPRIVGPHNRGEWQRYEVPVVETLLDAAYMVGDKEANAALRSTEFVRVRSLLERFGRTRVPIPPNFPEALRVQDETLRRATDDLLARLRTELINDTAITAELANVETMEQAFLRSLPAHLQKYASIRSGNPLEPSEVIKERFGDSDTAVLAFFPAREMTYVWRLDRYGNTTEWYRAAVTEDEIQLLGAESYARDWKGESVDKVVGALLGNCLRSIEPGTTLCLVAGGLLSQIPFSASKLHDGKYLCESYPVALLPSFSLAGFWEVEERLPRSAMVFSNSLGDLREAQKEANIVAEVLKCPKFSRRDVTRARLHSAVQSCDVIHVACHAEYDSSDPLNSGIMLDGGQRFTCRDLMSLDTRARFAFLSACESARLSVSSGDELVGLPSSILYSGFEAVVGSLWRVRDRETRLLVDIFYQHLRSGKDIARCLQAAQLDLLKNNRTSSPYFWGAWQVVGNWKTQLN